MSDPLEMQILASIAIDDTPKFEPGTDAESLNVALGCTIEEVDAAVASLLQRRLIAETINYDDQRVIAMTAAGVSRLNAWLDRASPLFGRWPPHQPDVDDAIN